jgi:glycosyltransferase involved in cell wall biosynthesis
MSRRILFVDEDQERNGSTVSMEYLVRGFKNAGYAPYVLTWKQQEWTKTQLKAMATLIDGRWGPVTTLTMCVHFTYTASPFSFAGMRNIAKDLVKFVVGVAVVAWTIRKVRPDLVYVNEYSVAQAALAARWSGVPVAMHIRSRILQGTWGFRRYLVSRLVLGCSSAIFPITRIEAEQLSPRNEERNKIHVVGEFFPAPSGDTLQPETCKERFGLPLSKKIVTMLGGIKDIKGTLEYLMAAREVHSTHPGTVFVIAGSDYRSGSAEKLAYYDACMQIARELEQDGACVLLGDISNPLDLVAASDMIASPSPQTHFSRPIIEGWGYGKPVVTVRTPHMEALVTDDLNGLVVETGDVHALANGIARLLDDEALCRRLGAEGKRKTQQEFDAEANLGKIVDRCNAMLGSAPGENP